MNNLKRVLSLGLVGAMLSGMMIMGAGAATYSDADEIDNVEAVETMGALNIINGTDKGTFDPDGFVTRGQMAKMIAVAMNGGKEPNFGAKTKATYTDISGHWAESFIEYCTDLDIISGRGDGTFDPDGNVTGTEAAKMVLSALGYDAEAYQLIGAEWANNVNKQATQSCSPSLYDSVENVIMSQPIDRDTAAQIIWNGLQNNVLEMSPDKVINTGEVSFGYAKSTRTLLNVRYGALVGYGTLNGNSKNLTSLTDGHIQITSFLPDSKDAAVSGNYRTVSFPWDMDLTLIGEKVKVIFKDGTQGTKEYPDKNDTIYGVFCAYETEVVNDIIANVKKVETDGKYVLKIGDTEYDVNQTTGVDVWYNFQSTATSYTKAAPDQLVCKKDGSDLYKALTKNGTIDLKNGDTIKAVLTDGKVTDIYVVNTTLQYVTAVSADKVTISNVGTIKKASNEVYEGIAKNDVVTVTTLYNAKAADDDAFNIVEKAEVVTGEIDKFKNADSGKNSTITVDGTAYKVYNEDNFTVKVDNKFLTTVSADEIGDEVELYMVNGYVAAVKQLSEDAKNYSVVIDTSKGEGVGNFFSAAKIRVMAADGTKTTLELDKDSTYADGNKIKTGTDNVAPGMTYDQEFDAKLPVGSIVTYDMNKDGTATVKVKSASSTTGTATYDKDTKSVVYPGAPKGTVTDPNCVLFVDNGDEFKAYTLRNLKDIDSSTAWTVVLDDGKVVAAYLKTTEDIQGAGSSRVYGIVSADNGTAKIDGTSYRQFVVNVNGEEYTVNQKATVWSSLNLKKGFIVSFEPTSDGIYESATAFEKVADGAELKGGDAAAVWVKEYVADDGIITVYNGITYTYAIEGDTTSAKIYNKGTDGKSLDETATTTYAVDDDVKMYFVDTDADTGLADSSVATLNTMTGYKTAYLILDSKDVVVAIIAEVGGEQDVTK